MKRALIIVNPTAGQWRPLQIAERTQRHLQATGWAVSTVCTECAAHAVELAAEHGGAVDRVIVVGGDGTLREVVMGLPDRSIPVALVPVGKANVVARDLGIPLDPDAAIRAVTSDHEIAMDVGHVGDTIFLAMVGVGYDGWVTAGVARMRRTAAGAWLYRHAGSSLIYFLAGLPSLLRLLPCRTRVEIEGTAASGAYPSLVISNTETYALGWSMTPGARVDDGSLDHQLNRASAPWFVLWTLAAALRRRPLPTWLAEHGRGRSYTVRARRPFRWQVDGDPMPPTDRLDIRIVPGHFRMIVPRPAA